MRGKMNTVPSVAEAMMNNYIAAVKKYAEKIFTCLIVWYPDSKNSGQQLV